MTKDSPAVPPLSGRDAPRFTSADQKRRLGGAFHGQGEDYDRLRPGYPEDVVGRVLDHAASPPGARAGRAGLRVVDLGAGTGKLTRAMAQRGAVVAEVTAVDPSASMLAILSGAGPAATTGAVIRTRVGTAEDTGLPEGCADLVTVAQAWHWFDHEAAGQEIHRVLGDGGVLALLWNSLDVRVPWVHRLSRIMHAGDVLKDDFRPEVPSSFSLEQRHTHRWEQYLPTPDLVDLARTRSYVLTATPEQRERVLANLDWYLHDHLGHDRGETVGLPYRTDLFLYRVA